MVVNTLPQGSFSRSVKSCRKEVSDEVFPPLQVISLVYISSGHFETEAFLTVGTPVMKMMAQLLHAVLYSLSRFGSTFQKLLPSSLETLKTS